MTPKASNDAVGGVTMLDDGRPVLLVRVRAVPDKGAANKAVCALLAKALRLPKSSVRLESGATARLKTVLIDGDAQQIAASLTELAGIA